MFKYKRKSNTLERRAINIFKTTKNPEEAGYITTSGEFLYFPSPAMDKTSFDRGHFRIMRLSSKTSINTNDYINRTKNIRIQVTPTNASFEVRQLPNESQWEALQEAGKNRKIFSDYTNENGESIKSGQFADFSEFKHWVMKNAI